MKQQTQILAESDAWSARKYAGIGLIQNLAARGFVFLKTYVEFAYSWWCLVDTVEAIYGSACKLCGCIVSRVQTASCIAYFEL